MNCPHCQKELSGNVKATLAKESAVSLVVKPAAGELFNVETVGATIGHFATLLKAVGKEMGIQTIVLLQSVETIEDGGLSFNCIVCRNGNRKVDRTVGPSEPLLDGDPE